jgi:two-component system, OmpR family, heavy metal sensor histidine kinase CusS
MKSIRLSLLLYFLLLLAVALGSVSAWAYQHTRLILDSNVKMRGAILQQDFRNAREREERKFRHTLAEGARTIARQAQIQLQSLPLAEIQFHEDVLPTSPDNPYVVEFFQVNTEGGKTWRSSSMGDRSFAFDRELSRNKPPYLYDDAVLQPALPVLTASTIGLLGLTQGQGCFLAVSALSPERMPPSLAVKRITIKAAATPRFFRGPEPRASHSEKPPLSLSPPERTPVGPRPEVARWPPPPFPELSERTAPTLYIQCAAQTTQLDGQVDKLRKQLESDLANLSEESRKTLSSLRNRLLLIGLATFAATVVGGIWLVRLGLSPLQRLSEAVSRVSAKDFRLPFDEPNLPRELRPIVERLTKTLELLKRTFAREKQAAADISHELRTPLSALLTTAEVALRKPRSAEEYRELLADCHATGQQMSQLIERLLALARLDAGVDTLRPREVDVSNVAEQCATLVRPLVAARGLTLRVDRNGPVMLNTDPDKLREVLTNLLHNAIQYNRPQGSIELALARENGRILVEVRDTGIGIAADARQHIFERFYRADPSRQADGLHAGLGLAIVKGYVDLMGGTITVESTEGQGTTFRVELPAR